MIEKPIDSSVITSGVKAEGSRDEFGGDVEVA